MAQNLIMKSLPLVASVLGRKYGVKVEIGGNSAFTDGNTIQLPSLSLDCDETLIGLARGFIDHESAHIRETRFDWLKLANLTPLEKHVWNTFEDWRVENRLARLFPGCRSNFNWLILHLFGDDKEQPADPAMAILNWLLLSVRAWDVPSLGKQRDDVGVLVEINYPGLLSRLNFVLQKIHAHCDSTQDCILYAREVVSILESITKEEQRSQTTENTGVKNGQEGKNDDCDGVPKGLQKMPNPQHNLLKLIAANTDEIPKGVGEILEEHLTKKTPSNLEHGLTVARLGRKMLKPIPDAELAATQKASIALRTRLHCLLQAKVLSRSRLSRHGRLDPRQLHRLAIADARVFRRNREKQGIDTAVHILVDCSGSMRKRIKLTTQACYAVASALDAIQSINVGVTAFPAGTPTDGGSSNSNGPTVCPVIAHGERIHSKFGMSAAGCTPLGEALWWVLQQMLSLKESRKLILILTDGDPDSVPNTLEAIEASQSLGFEVYGLGIKVDAITKLLPNHSRVIRTLSELAPAMFGMLQCALVGK